MRKPASYYLGGGKPPKSTIGRIIEFSFLALLICATSSAMAENLPAALEGKCVTQGFTAETNALFLIGACSPVNAASPAIVFTEGFRADIYDDHGLFNAEKSEAIA